MIDFGKLEKVEKTYSREGLATRKQAYNGIKFRRWNAKGKDDEGNPTFVLKEGFTFSDNLIEKLNLNSNGFVQYLDGERDNQGKLVKATDVYLVLLDDKHEECRILKNPKGETKSMSITASILQKDMIDAGLLDATTLDNQYFTVEETSSTNAPSWVKGVYKIVKDTAVNKAEDTEEAEDAPTANASIAPETEQDF